MTSFNLYKRTIPVSSQPRHSQRGVSLIESCIFIMVLAIVVMAASPMLRIYLTNKHTLKTEDSVSLAQAALNDYFQKNHRFPCPAPRTAAVDTASYGKETTCNAAASGLPTGTLADGTSRALGRKNIPVRIGALPVRTLGVADNTDIDGFDHRLIYAVTENYATTSAPDSLDKGAITVRDSNGNNTTSDEGNVIYTVVAPGADRRGAYNSSGQLLAACGSSSTPAGENCDNDGTFISTILTNNSTGSSAFTSKMALRAGKLCKSQTKALSGGITPIQLTGLVVGQQYEIISKFYQQVYTYGFSPLFHSSVGFYLTDPALNIKNITLLAPDTNPATIPSGSSVTKSWKFIADAATIDVGIFIVPNWSATPPVVPPQLFNPAVTDNLRFVRVDASDTPITPIQLAKVTDTQPPALVWVDPTTNAILGRLQGTYAPGYGAYGAGGAVFHSQGNMNPGRVSHMLGMDEVCTYANWTAGDFVGANHHTKCVGVTPQQNVGPNPADPDSLDFGFEDAGGIGCYEMMDGTCQLPSNWPGPGAGWVGGGPSWPFTSPSNVPWVTPMPISYTPAGWASSTPRIDTYGGYVAQVGDSSFSDVNANITIETCGP